MTTEIEPREVTYEEAIALLKNAREVARDARGSIDLSAAERRNARFVTETLSDEIERVSVLALKRNAKVYEDEAKLIGPLLDPLRDLREDIRKIERGLGALREAVRILDDLLGVALRFAT